MKTASRNEAKEALQTVSLLQKDCDLKDNAIAAMDKALKEAENDATNLCDERDAARLECEEVCVMMMSVINFIYCGSIYALCGTS